MTIHRVHSVHSLLSMGRSFGFADRVEKMHIPDLLQEERMFKTLSKEACGCGPDA